MGKLLHRNRSRETSHNVPCAVAGRGRWRRHGLIRPSVAGAIVLAGDAAFWFLALMLDDRVLVVGALLLAIVWICSLMTVVAQWLSVGRGATSWVTPRSVHERRQYERLDQDGRVIERFAGDRPTARGLYRCVSLFAWWHDPFGLFSASRVLPQRDELVVLPDADDKAGNGRQATDQRLQGQSHSDDTGGVRDYVPGDPPKLISWKATAHRGELMTRETGREVQAATIVVLDARRGSVQNGAEKPDADVSAVTAGQLDAQIEHVLPLLETTSAHRRLIVTDGVRVADEPSRVARLLAAAMPVVDDDADEHAYASRVREIVSRQQGVVNVRLLTPHPQGALAAALRRVVGQDQLRVVEVAEPETDGRGAPARETSRGISRGTARETQTAGYHAGLADDKAAIASRAFAAAALIVFFTFSVLSLTSIIAGGWWSWFLGVGLALVAVEANLPCRSRARYAARTLAVIALVAVAALALIVFRIRAGNGLWLFDGDALQRNSINEIVIDPAAATSQDATDAVSGITPWRYLADEFAAGFTSLNMQLPPVNVNADGDVVLLAAAAAIVIVMRLLLVARRSTPAFALLPVVAFAADYAFMGREADLWRIVAVALLFLLSLWAVRPERAFPALPVTASAVVAALVFSLTPSTLDLAYAVPIALGNSTGLLTANTINPMVDLKRSLTSGSASTVLTYKATDRTYLRMATLDDFNGDMWSYDESLAKSAELYGAGIQLGHNADEDDDSEYMFQTNDPLYLYSNMLSVVNGDVGGSYEAPNVTLGSENTMNLRRSMSQYYIDVDVTITTLRSRFLPVPAATSFVSGLSGWMRSGSTIYSRESSTDQGMQYGAYGIGMQPITSTTEFRRISSVASLRDSLKQTMTTLKGDEETLETKWQRMVDDGVATLEDGWLLIPVTMDADGTVRDSSGSEIGSASYTGNSDDPYMSSVGNPKPDISAGMFLADAFRRSVGYDDESTTLALGVDNNDENRALLGVHNGSLAEQTVDPSTGEPEDDEDTIGGSTSTFGVAVNLFEKHGYDMRWSLNGQKTDDKDMAAAMQKSFDRIDELNARAASRYRSLPDDLPGNVTALVKQAKADGVATDGKGYDHQVAAMQWLVDYFTNSANGFAYSLDAPDGNGRSNLDVINDFLKERSGYCTHYATTLAVLGRAMGVPTRVVLGYNRGVGDSIGGTYVVAAKQLHAWTEAYIDDIGWVPFDVTPATTENGSASDSTDTSGSSSSTGSSTDDTPTVDLGDKSGNANETTDGATTEDGTSDETTDDTAADATAGKTTRRIVPEDASPWMAAAIWTAIVLCVLLAISLLPALARRLRRMRRLATVRRSGSRRGWLAGWAELCDSAWDAGLRWSDSDTDRTIGALIAERFGGALGSDAPDGGAVDYARHVDALLFADGTGAAGAAASGVAGEPSSECGPYASVANGLAAIRETCRTESWPRRLHRFLFPASFLRRR
ncbi:transglutaminaseTgpA domain-containing protein [Bifidobacterium biavatii]|uniref:Transglutaminase n=1 Tax=Bifidobacterium biavatii DSM 23969 TaxID=1437608 RepID=A0A086ZRG4_9BIFI|nr:transglutaminaseTgpA domain-containing protein [Bifidobacterium biavatii]KFI49114.1 transglutaminase [Bifidobacterium biavatii DSM 23969]